MTEKQKGKEKTKSGTNEQQHRRIQGMQEKGFKAAKKPSQRPLRFK